jgi:hypothetical protein
MVERLSGARQVSGLQSLADGGEILLAEGVRKRVSAGKRPALAELGNILEGGFSGGQIAGAQRLPECVQIALPGVEILLDWLVQRATGNG